MGFNLPCKSSFVNSLSGKDAFTFIKVSLGARDFGSVVGYVVSTCVALDSVPSAIQEKKRRKVSLIIVMSNNYVGRASDVHNSGTKPDFKGKHR